MFKVEKYGEWLLILPAWRHSEWLYRVILIVLCPVLPKFEVTIETKDEVNIIQDSFEAKVCAK